MTTNPPPLTIVIVTYNSRHQIVECLAPLAGRPDDVRIRVRDNGSTDSTPLILRDLRRRGHIDDLILSADDAGFAVAANDVIARSGADDVLLLNPDARVDLDAVRAMRDAALAEPAIGAVAPVVVNGSGISVMSAGRQPRLWPMITHYSGLSRAFPRYRALRGRHLFLEHHAADDQLVEWTSGCCLLVPRRTIDRVGVLTERYFLYAEDTEWCKRIVDAGMTIKVLTGIRVQHEVGSSADASGTADVAAVGDTAGAPDIAGADPVPVTGIGIAPPPNIGTMWGRNLYDYYVHEFRPSAPTRLAWRVTFTVGNAARALARRARERESATADRLMQNALAIWR